MSPDTVYQGLAVSEGVAAGQVYPGGHPARHPAAQPPMRWQRPSPPWRRTAPRSPGSCARTAAASRRTSWRSAALIAADPALVDPAVAAVRDGAEAAAAVERSAATQAAALAALANPDLAARADDVRQVARAVLARLAGERGTACRRGLHPHPARGGSGGPDPLRRGRADAARCRCPAAPTRMRRSSRAGWACPCWRAPTRRCSELPARGRPALLDGAAGHLVIDPSAAAARRRVGRPRAPPARAAHARRQPRPRQQHRTGAWHAALHRRRPGDHPAVQCGLRHRGPDGPRRGGGGSRPAAHRDSLPPRHRLARRRLTTGRRWIPS